MAVAVVAVMAVAAVAVVVAVPRLPGDLRVHGPSVSRERERAAPVSAGSEGSPEAQVWSTPITKQ